MKSNLNKQFLLAIFGLSFICSQAKAETYLGVLGGIGKDTSSDSATFVYGANAGSRILETLRLGVYYQTLRLTEKGSSGGTYNHRVHLAGLDLGAYLPVLLDLYAGIKLGISNIDGGVANGVSVASRTRAAFGLTAGYDFKILPIMSIGLEADAMRSDGVLYALLGTVKLWF
jgi:hypothetical protein